MLRLHSISGVAVGTWILQNAGISNLVYTVLHFRRFESSAEVLWEPQVIWIRGSWFSYAMWWQDKPPRTLWVFGSEFVGNFVGNECKVVRSSVQPNIKTKLTSRSDDLCYCWGGVSRTLPMLGQLCQFQVINWQN